MRKNIIILILLSVLLSGCQLTTAINHNLFNKRQVKITEFAVPYLDNFIPIFFKENTIIAQQGIDVPKHEMSLYSSSNFKEYKKIAFFENHFGQFYVNPYNSKEVFFVSNEGEKSIFKSINQGYSWQKVYNGPADNLVFHPTNKNELFLVKNNTAQGTEIIKSNDSGIHWNKITSTKEISWAYQLVIDPMNYEHFLIPARNGLWESLNGGLSWKQIYQESEPSVAIFDPAENNKAFFVAKDSLYELHNGNIKKINIPNMSALICGCGIACQTSTNKIFAIIIWQKNKNTDYNTTIYQVKNDSLTPITQVIKSKDRIIENLIFDNTNPKVMYFYSYKTIYKIDL